MSLWWIWSQLKGRIWLLINLRKDGRWDQSPLFLACSRLPDVKYSWSQNLIWKKMSKTQYKHSYKTEQRNINIVRIYMFCIIEFNIIRLLVNYMLIILFFVNHDMLLKVASLIKHLATYLAYIWFITSVLSLSSIYAVSLNIPLLIKQNSYYLTKRKIAKST